MERSGPNFGLPYTRPFGDGLFEIRAKGDSSMNTDNTYNPIRLNPAEEVAEKRANDPEFRIAYDALEDEFAALAALLDARLQAGLTQAQVASRMGVSQPVLARIESSLGKQDHSPSSIPCAGMQAPAG
jgi:ribosome-binding protein aMBF1 (putative translation factor)